MVKGKRLEPFDRWLPGKKYSYGVHSYGPSSYGLAVLRGQGKAPGAVRSLAARHTHISVITRPKNQNADIGIDGVAASAAVANSRRHNYIVMAYIVMASVAAANTRRPPFGPAMS